MQKSDKERVVAELTQRLKASETLIVADYRGLSMTEIDRLRGELLQNGARFSVVKNTLTRRAAEAAGADALLELLDGPTAIAFLEPGGDPVTVAKVLNEAVRSTRILVIRGGVLGGKVINEEDVKNLATLPPPDVLRAQTVGAISAPLTTVVGIFTAPLRDIVGVLDARVRQLEERGDAPATAAEEVVTESTSAPSHEAAAEAPSEGVAESADQEANMEQEA
ncbi:MAG: 50S ribosomal protein L10 [Actinobacteria bacterium]|nr:50S ribosomal protein L10 [Actinomycetota bacterium]